MVEIDTRILRVIMEKWETEEANVYINMIMQANYPSILSQLYCFVLSVAEHGLFSLDSVAFGLMFTLYRTYFARLKAISSPFRKYWTVFIIWEIVQILIASNVYFQHESFTLHLVNSTSLLILAEVSPIHSLPFNSFLVLKHIVVWAGLAWSKGAPGEVISVVPILWVFWNVLCAQDHKRKLLMGKHRAEQEKEGKERRLRALLFAMPDGVVVFSHKLSILTHNPAIAAQLGVLHTDTNAVATMEMLIGEINYDPEYLSPEEHTQVFKADLYELIAREEGAVKSFSPLLYAGKHLECRGCVTKWDESKVLVLTVRDTSNWAQLEKAAKRDSANKTALIRSVSHELRTPVNAILNLCQDLQESTSLVDQDRADVEILANASSFLLSMINDLLDYSRILHDRLELVKTRFDLEHLIRSCGQLIALQCKHKNVDFTVRLDPQLPQFAYSDENRLKQVILNLLSNAAKFTMKGSVALIAMLSGSGQLQVSVEDTGIGIPSDKQGTIFTMFGKLDSGQLNPQGCGLGLSISSMLVGKLGGKRIHVLSTPHHGSTFSFEMPITMAPQSFIVEYDEEISDIANEHEDSMHTFVSQTTTSAQILIVDDAPFNRLVLRKILTTAGYSFAEASTGLEAVNSIRAAWDRGKPFSVVLMDIEMPEMDGITAARELGRLVREGVLPCLPVVIGCSAYCTEEDRASALASGMTDYLEKPISRQRLLELLSINIE